MLFLVARIIVIDDQEFVRSAVRRALEPVGHEVREASDGEVGLQLLADHGADLVITDIFMPGQDGIVTVRRIRREFPTVRVIVMSGGDATGRMDLRQDALMLGAAKSLAKPFELAELRAAVQEVLGGPKD
jgi:DNA-binding response OmpR family regulator